MQKGEMYASVTTLEEERAELMALKETLQKYVRQLEQANDDLERGKRSDLAQTMFSLISIRCCYCC